jgi:hypothetical protein
MKNKNQFLQISLTAFVLALVPQILIAVLYRLVYEYGLIPDYYPLVTLFNYVNLLLRFTIIPVLIFAVFYFIGKKLDLNLELRPVMLALLIGNFASLIIGSIIYSVILARGTISIVNVSENVLISIATLLAVDFFAAFTGLSIGYIRQKKLTLTAEPELS